MRDGSFTGAKLSDFNGSDFTGMRAIVNGTDRAGLIAGYATKYAAALNGIGSLGLNANSKMLDALNMVANGAKGAVKRIGAITEGTIQGALNRIPAQYRSAIEAVLSGASKTLPAQLAAWLNDVMPGLTQGGFSGDGNAAKIVATARSWVGKEFNPGVLAQCANFVRSIFKQAGSGLSETLGRSADGGSYGVEEAGSLLKESIGQVIRDKSKIMAGDIIVWSKTYGDFGNDVTHTGIATGNGMMIDRSTSSEPVRERAIDTFGNFVAAIRTSAGGPENVNVNAKTLADGLKKLAGSGQLSNLTGSSGSGVSGGGVSVTEALQKAIDKLKNSKTVIVAGTSEAATQKRLEIAMKDLELLKTKAEALTSEKQKTANAEAQVKMQERIDRINAQIEAAAAKNAGNGNVKKLGELQDLQKQLSEGTITEAEALAKAKEFGVKLEGVAKIIDKTKDLEPTMRSLFTILSEGLKDAITLAKEFRQDANPISRQLGRLDLSNTQRLNALPQVYQALLRGGGVQNIQPNQGYTGGRPLDVNIAFTTRSMGGEQYVPLSQATAAVRQTATVATQARDQYQNSYADRLRSGIG